MFRMEFIEGAKHLTVRIEGRFVGHFAEEARLLVARRKILPRLIVDLTDITFVDAMGEEALTWMHEIGARFLAGSSYSLDVCERLRLPLAPFSNTMPPAAAD